MVEVNEEILSKLKNDLEKLLDSEFRSFHNLKELSIDSGIYLIYFGSNVIYVGSTKNLKDRMKQLFLFTKKSKKGTEYWHTLSNKLNKEFSWNKEKVENFLKNSCKFKFILLNLKYAKLLEHFTIAVINPKYND